MSNLFADIPKHIPHELKTVLAESQHARVERIVSNGHATPDGDWYDQEQHEWVAVLAGEATLQFEDGGPVPMKPGDQIVIPAHKKHRVTWTTPDKPTVWLAVFYSD